MSSPTSCRLYCIIRKTKCRILTKVAFSQTFFAYNADMESYDWSNDRDRSAHIQISKNPKYPTPKWKSIYLVNLKGLAKMPEFCKTRKEICQSLYFQYANCMCHELPKFIEKISYQTIPFGGKYIAKLSSSYMDF